MEVKAPKFADCVASFKELDCVESLKKVDWVESSKEDGCDEKEGVCVETSIEEDCGDS